MKDEFFIMSCISAASGLGLNDLILSVLFKIMCDASDTAVGAVFGPEAR